MLNLILYGVLGWLTFGVGMSVYEWVFIQKNKNYFLNTNGAFPHWVELTTVIFLWPLFYTLPYKWFLNVMVRLLIRLSIIFSKVSLRKTTRDMKRKKGVYPDNYQKLIGQRISQAERIKRAEDALKSYRFK